MSLWENLAITVKPFYIEARLKQGYEMKKHKRNNKRFNNRGASLFVSMNIF